MEEVEVTIAPVSAPPVHPASSAPARVETDGPHVNTQPNANFRATSNLVLTPLTPAVLSQAINCGYLDTLPGQLNLALLILTFVCMVCICVIHDDLRRKNLFSTNIIWQRLLAITCFTAEFLYMIVKLFRSDEMCSGVFCKLPSKLIMVAYGILCLFHLSAAIGVLHDAVVWAPGEAILVAGIFGFLITFGYGYQFYRRFEVYWINRNTAKTIPATA